MTVGELRRLPLAILWAIADDLRLVLPPDLLRSDIVTVIQVVLGDNPLSWAALGQYVS